MIPDRHPVRHEDFERIVDEMLVAGVSAPDSPSGAPRLREHLQTCAACREHLDSGMRILSGLKAFSFPVDPALPAKIGASLRLRAEQLESTRISGRTVALASAVALALTLAGSFIDLRLSGFLATLLEVQRAQVQQGLLTFWIVPSLCLLLLFPMLPLLGRRKEGAV